MRVPFRQVRYDNLSPAVAKVLTGRNRTETPRWLSFRSFINLFREFPGVPGLRVAAGGELTWVIRASVSIRAFVAFLRDS